MSSEKPTLRINPLRPRNPRCSVCGCRFGSEGFAEDLIDAFALHVRRHHMRENSNLMTRQIENHDEETARTHRNIAG
jgi:hypothetical protein